MSDEAGFPSSLAPDIADDHEPELALSWWWNTADLSRPLTLADGRALSVVFRGRWSHGLGADFQDAMLTFDRRTLMTGAIEMHVRASDWRAHGHHLDPRYDNVELHVVVENNDAPARRADGREVPTFVVDKDALVGASGLNGSLDWSTVGGATCAESIAAAAPSTLVRILHRLGDHRLQEKVGSMEAELLSTPPNQVLYRAMMDALGYSSNRGPMTHLATILPISAVAQSINAWDFCPTDDLVSSLLLGCAGFFPLSPSLATIAGFDPEEVGRLELAWSKAGPAWFDLALSPAAWTNLRVRPANHPLTRLIAAASLITDCGAVLPSLVERTLSADDPVITLMESAQYGDQRLIGKGRASAIVANVFIPWALATTGSADANTALQERASVVWEQLNVVEPNAISTRAQHQVAGKHRLPGLGIRGQQGLIHLDRTLCTPRRCFECPIAAVALTATSSGDRAPHSPPDAIQ